MGITGGGGTDSPAPGSARGEGVVEGVAVRGDVAAEGAGAVPCGVGADADGPRVDGIRAEGRDGSLEVIPDVTGDEFG
ncbi:MAG TPA: hypothetical protein VM575_16690, partial [Nocardioides sp.]|nr:hypothetical protein [Nocardioides sp.]